MIFFPKLDLNTPYKLRNGTLTIKNLITNHKKIIN